MLDAIQWVAHLTLNRSANTAVKSAKAAKTLHGIETESCFWCMTYQEITYQRSPAHVPNVR